jgi:hypothetical protein
MADGEGTPPGETRGGDRRGIDRRKTDRRAPVPPWRKPPALVAYGVVGTLLLVSIIMALRDDESPAAVPAGGGEVVAAPSPVPTKQSPVQPSAPEPALTTADFERLTIEGDSARGRRVVAQLWCEAPVPVAVRADTIESAVAALVDTTGGQSVPGAECKWGGRDDPRRGDFILLVPPALAGEFSSAPVIMDGYVRRRRLVAEVEWIGKSRALALSTVGVFKGLAQER